MHCLRAVRFLSRLLPLAVLGLAGLMPAARAAEPELVIDLMTDGGGVQFLIAGGDRALFWNNTPDHGTELWQSDGSVVGTQLIRDIAPGRANSGGAVQNWKTIGTRTWFSASTRGSGFEPWVTDGTGGGTRPLGDLNPGNADSSSWAFTDIGNGAIVFIATTAEGAVLFRSEGAQATTTKVKVLSTTFSFPTTDAGGRLMGTNRAVLCVSGKAFVTDGTAAGTSELALPGGGPTPNTVLVASNGVYLHRPFPTTSRFYFSDGTPANTRLLDGGADVVLPRTAVGSRLVFATTANLKSTDGTQAGMNNLDAIPTFRQISTANNRYWITSGGGSFNGTGFIPPKLHASDGTAAGTVEVLSQPVRFQSDFTCVEAGGLTWFLAATTASGNRFDTQLFKSNGTAAGTSRVVVWNNPVVTDDEAGLIVPQGGLAAVGQHIFITNRDHLIGVNAATNQVTLLTRNTASPASSNPTYLTPFKDGFFFWADVGGKGAVIKPHFYRPGSGLPPLKLSDISPLSGEGGGGETSFDMGSFLLFNANDNQGPAWPDYNGSELWRTDGTPAGTFLVRDLCPGRSSGFLGSFIGRKPGSTSELLLVASTTVGDHELWKTDGTAAGTVLVKDINPGLQGSFPRKPIDMGGYWLFSALSTTGRELWRSDGTEAGTTLVKDINPGPGHGIDNNLEWDIVSPRIGNMIYFSAGDNATGLELWKSDGTPAGTTLVKDIRPGPASSRIRNLTAFKGKVYFVAYTDANGRELWTSDGTAAGTVLVKDIRPGSAGSMFDDDGNPDAGLFSGHLTVSGDQLFFAANDGTTGTELWVSDGTAAGTVLSKDIRPGAQGSDLRGLVDVAGVLCFAANDGINGLELWQSDGTPGNTFLAGDINTGPGSILSSPGNSYPFFVSQSDLTFYRLNRPDAAVIGGTVFFSAHADSVGRELWKYTPSRVSNPAGTIAFSAAAYAAGEAAGNAVVTVTRTGGSGSTTVDFRTITGGTATPGSDYVVIDGQITFLAGETAKGVIIPLINDGVVEPAETIRMSLSNPTGGARLGLALATLTISDGGTANRVPSATPQAVTTAFNTARTISLGGTDPDGSVVTIAGVSAPSSGTLSGSGSNRIFTPASGFTGTATFTFTVSDGVATSAPATVTITVSAAANQAPTASAKTVITSVDTPIEIILTGSDPEGSALLLNSTSVPSSGQLIGSGQVMNRTYVPATGFIGTATFTFTVSDGSAVSAPATVTIQVVAANQPPVATARSLSTPTSTPLVITLSGTDPEGSAVTVVATTAPAHGSLVPGAGTWTYTPTPGYIGPDSFTFQVSDGVLTSAAATVSIAVGGSAGDIPGDLNGSGTVTFEDLSLFLSSYGKSVGQAGFLSGANLNTAGSSATTVDFDDLAAFLVLYHP